jgi:hypothetical protein
MRPNQTEPPNLPFRLEGFEWPGKPRVIAMGRGGEAFRVREEDAQAVLDALRARPGAYVSCQDHHALELNPAYGNEVTPLGIYGFPRDYFAHLVWWWTKDLYSYPATGIEFAHRPNLFVFDLEGPILDTDFYASSVRARDMERLAEAWQPGSRAVRDLGFEVDATGVERTMRRWLRDSDRYGDMPTEEQAKHFLWAMESALNAMLPVVQAGDSGFYVHPNKPALWRAMLVSLGYVAFLDRHARLTGDIEQQVAVLQPEAIRNLSLFRNPINPAVRLETRAPRP